MDGLDLGILELLSQNCRLANTVIADALRVSQNTIANRITALENAGVIREYVTIFDLRPLGFTRHHILMRFSGKGAGIHAICRELSKASAAVWIPSYIGTYDAQVIVDSHEKLPLNQVLEDLFTHCTDKLSDYTVFTDDTDIQFTHLLPQLDRDPSFIKQDDGSFSDLLTTRSFPAPSTFGRFKYSRLDIDLLYLLAKDPRGSLTKFAKTLHCDRQTGKRRIKRLIKAGIILNFGIGIDHSRLGYTAYHLLFRLKHQTPQKLIKKVFCGSSNVFYAGTVIGAYDLSAYIYAQTPTELSTSVQEIRSEFGEYIVRYDLLIYDKIHHWQQFSPAACKVLKETL